MSTAINVNLPLNIRIGVNRDNNIIFLNCDGFETEIFMPTVIGSRLSLINVVPQRRCSCIATSHIISKAPVQQRISAKNGKKFIPSFASSTPERSNLSKSVEGLNSNAPVGSNILSMSDQEVRSIQANSQSLQINDIIILEGSNDSVNDGYSINVNGQTPKLANVGVRPAHALASADQTRNTAQIQKRKTCNFLEIVNLPDESYQANEVAMSIASPSPAPRDVSIISDVLSNIEYPRTPSPMNWSLLTSSIIASPTNVQWRSKVLTPVRTYSRRRYSPNKSFVSISASRSSVASTTPGIETTKRVIQIKQKKTKRIFDARTTVSPKSFKQQLETRNADEDRWAYRKEIESTSFGINKNTAFDFFTTPTSENRCFAPKLIETFRLRCVNKGSSTYPKYKKLARTAPVSSPLLDELTIATEALQVSALSSMSEETMSPAEC